MRRKTKQLLAILYVADCILTDRCPLRAARFAYRCKMKYG